MSDLRSGIRSARRAVNLRFRPGLQLRLPLIVVVLTTAFGALFAVHTEQAYGTLIRIGIDQPELRALVADQGVDFLVVSLAIAAAYVLSILVACLADSHRALGPIVAFRQHLEGMKNGDFVSRLSLRAGEPFNDVADDLNELSSILRKQQKREGA